MTMTEEQKDKLVHEYEVFVNSIDDFFEYRYRGYDKIDTRDYVYQNLNTLSQKIKEIGSDG